MAPKLAGSMDFYTPVRVLLLFSTVGCCNLSAYKNAAIHLPRL